MTKAAKLKMDWMEMPDECFETLTFGELTVGQKFIALPLPGDNHIHGGLRKAHYVFMKTEKKIERFGIPAGEAVNNRGIKASMPYSMNVILIE